MTTNLNLVSAGAREMSDQEYFVYVDVGVMFTLSFYPKILTHDLFSNTSTLGRSDFLVLPGLHGVFALQ